ncbi:uncharacterized protein LOC117166897 [Belonocnema kinseyi]|uniref:uncharacterized protein LOC117166897 n=1 Tax=Belonocnema kinseyi TaxID=2817044 RepID=UPI00143CF2C6|nr:uncharacterized protein LOC117166897 [Belonocnema kinseyi]
MMNMWKVRELMDKATNVVMNYTDTEAKVREATNDDAWGPTGAMMQELAQATFTYEQFPEVMSMLWKRMLQENKRNWRRTYKALLLLNYLVRNGSERVVTSSREHIYDLKSLENYTYIDEFGKDQGINIRHKVKELIDFIQDDDKLRDERKKAKKNKDKYVGMSSDAMGMRWSDTPKWNKPNQESYNDWDREGRGKGFEDGNNSDDGEREDSDNDTRSSPRRTGKEYRDTLETIDRIGKITPSFPPSSTSPARGPRPLKKVDLGAAANFGKDQSNIISPPHGNLMTSPVKQQKSTNNILNELFESNNENSTSNIDKDDDDFNPRANTYSSLPTQNVNAPDFGDFSSAFGGSTNKVKDNDEFADFTSAFNSGLALTSPISPPPQLHQTDIMSGIGNLGQSTTNNLSGTMLSGSQSNISAFDNLGSGNISAQNTTLMGNNIFNSLQPQGIHSLNSSNNNTASNTDLLTDLGGFNAPSMLSSVGQTNNVNNANIFNSMNSTPSLITDSIASRPEETLKTEDFSKHSADSLLKFLQSAGTIKAQTDLQQLKRLLEKYLDFFPGCLTPQKYLYLDQDIEIDTLLYGNILDKIIEIFDHNWPLSSSSLDPLIKNLFVVEGCTTQMFHESILSLTNALKETEKESKILCISFILDELLRSDALFSAIINSSMSCRVMEENSRPLEKEHEEKAWESIVQVLVSLPNRVANKAKKKMPDSFLPKMYAKIISFHLTRSISFLNDGLQFGVKANVQILSLLLSKMFLVMDSSHLVPLIDIFSEFCFENKDDIKSFIQLILAGMDRRSVETIVILILKHCSVGVSDILGNLATNQTWKYTLTTKVPLMSWYDDENLIRNLISYLSSFHSERILNELLLKLLDIWGDKSVLNHTSFEQHLYLTKLIVLSMRSLKGRLTMSEKVAIKQLVSNGIRTHLESTLVLNVAIGMITGEIITEIVNEDGSPKLQFEYESLQEDAKLLVQKIRQLEIGQNGSKTRDKSDLSLGILEFTSTGARKMYDLGAKCKIIDFQVEEPKSDASNQSKVASDAAQEIKNLKAQHIEEELDSDDDLVPYDMSNDRKISEMSRPAYLRDLRDNLVNTESNQNPEIFSESVKVAEELILSQLPGDDASFGLELLEILVTLRENCHTENFEVLTFRACAAIVTVFPKECAEYLCREFYSKPENHSVSQRIFFLEILSESAKRLSRFEIPPESMEVEIPKKKKRLSKPVSLFINPEEKNKHETLYDDDFEAAKSSKSIDWEEIVQKRIDSKTKRFAHPMKIPKTMLNKFANVSTSFFYPLLYGFCRQGTYVYSIPEELADHDNFLLVAFLKTLATIMVAAQNCPSSTKMGKEIIDLVWILRYHREAKVRLSAIENIAAVVSTVSNERLLNELFEPLMEVRLWLVDMTQKVVGGEPDSNCRKLGLQVLFLIDSIFNQR